MWTPIATVFLSMGVAVAVCAQADLLSPGILVNGAVTFTSDKKTTSFSVSSSDHIVVIKVANEVAFSVTPNKSLSYQWTQRLTKSRRISVRVSDVREDLHPGTQIREDLLDLLMCVSKPAERSDGRLLYTLTCVAFDEERQVKSGEPTGQALGPKASGNLVSEVVMVVSVPTASASEAFLTQARPEKPLLYVRLE